jgi:hypothetical protein
MPIFWGDKFNYINKRWEVIHLNVQNSGRNGPRPTPSTLAFHAQELGTFIKSPKHPHVLVAVRHVDLHWHAGLADPRTNADQVCLWVKWTYRNSYTHQPVVRPKYCHRNLTTKPRGPERFIQQILCPAPWPGCEISSVRPWPENGPESDTHTHMHTHIPTQTHIHTHTLTHTHTHTFIS